MGFTSTYLERCWHNRKNWLRKRTSPGDWYLAGDPLELNISGQAEENPVDFSSDEVAFVPDTDDLFEFIDNQIAARGIDPEQKSITISYTPADQWHIRIDYGDWSTVAVRQESIHSLLAYALIQMSIPSS